MRKCLKISVSGRVQKVAYRSFAQKSALALNIEGTVQNSDNGDVVIHACGTTEQLDAFLDLLYKGSPLSRVEDINTEPFTEDKHFRGVFRVIGQ
jgi:acylphosphatase